jgi:hypothetical protein
MNMPSQTQDRQGACLDIPPRLLASADDGDRVKRRDFISLRPTFLLSHCDERHCCDLEAAYVLVFAADSIDI